MFKVNNKDIWTLKWTLKTFEIWLVDFEHVSHLVLAFLLLTLNIWMSAGKVKMKDRKIEIKVKIKNEMKTEKTKVN